LTFAATGVSIPGGTQLGASIPFLSVEPEFHEARVEKINPADRFIDFFAY
jgi:hypothetical protein